MQIKKETFDAYLDSRLRIWAAWQYRINHNEEGWPRASLIAIMCEVGALVRAHAKSKPPYDIANTWAHEMNTWINLLSRLHPLDADAVKAAYCEQKKLLELAKDRQISVRAFKQRLHDGRTWLSGRLAAESS